MTLDGIMLLNTCYLYKERHSMRVTQHLALHARDCGQCLNNHNAAAIRQLHQPSLNVVNPNQSAPSHNSTFQTLTTRCKNQPKVCTSVLAATVAKSQLHNTPLHEPRRKIEPLGLAYVQRLTKRPHLTPSQKSTSCCGTSAASKW
jgi:hypothetical protein